MSRTDVHTPNWVKMLDPAWRHHFYEHHDHRRGPCDLAEYHPVHNDRTRCIMMWDWRGRNIYCGCRMCTQQLDRLWNTRRERRRSRRNLRAGRYDLA